MSPAGDDQDLQRPTWRGILHAVTAPVAGVLGATVTVAAHGVAMVAMAVYVVSLTGAFTLSALYHRVARGTSRSRWWRRLDHAGIHLLIAGTYTPICVDLLPDAKAQAVLVGVWVVASLGAAAKLSGKFWRTASVLYLVQGWVALILLPTLFNRYGPAVALLVITGGVVYTAGAVVFFTRRPVLWPQSFGFHELWHVATVVAAALHFTAVSEIISRSAT